MVMVHVTHHSPKSRSGEETLEYCLKCSWVPTDGYHCVSLTQLTTRRAYGIGTIIFIQPEGHWAPPFPFTGGMFDLFSLAPESPPDLSYLPTEDLQLLSVYAGVPKGPTLYVSSFFPDAIVKFFSWPTKISEISYTRLSHRDRWLQARHSSAKDM